MTNLKYTDITVIIDKSPSMLELVDDTIGGFNAFLERQQQIAKATHSHCELQVVQFDDQYDEGDRYEVNVHPPLDRKSYRPKAEPGNGTALLDAIGRAIQDSGKRLALMKEDARPGKVLFVIVTDGSDNASHRFSLDDVREKILEQQIIYKWDFVYLGANQDAWAVGQQLGLIPGKTLSTAATKPGTRHAFDAMSRYASETLRAASAQDALKNRFTDDEVLFARRATNGSQESRVG